MKKIKFLGVLALLLGCLNLAACETLSGFGSSDRGQSGVRSGGIVRF